MMEFEQHPTEPDTLVIKMPKYYIAKYSYEDLRAAVLAEREACAKLCEKVHDDYINDHNNDGYDWPDGRNCADAIRARSKHD